MCADGHRPFMHFYPISGALSLVDVVLDDMLLSLVCLRYV